MEDWTLKQYAEWAMNRKRAYEAIEQARKLAKQINGKIAPRDPLKQGCPCEG